MADPRVQEIIGQIDDLPDFRQASLPYSQDPTGEFHKLIDGNYEVFLMTLQCYYIQRKLRREEFVDAIQHFMELIKNQQRNNVTLWQCWLNLSSSN